MDLTFGKRSITYDKRETSLTETFSSVNHLLTESAKNCSIFNADNNDNYFTNNSKFSKDSMKLVDFDFTWLLVDTIQDGSSTPETNMDLCERNMVFSDSSKSRKRKRLFSGKSLPKNPTEFIDISGKDLLNSLPQCDDENDTSHNQSSVFCSYDSVHMTKDIENIFDDMTFVNGEKTLVKCANLQNEEQNYIDAAKDTNITQNEMSQLHNCQHCIQSFKYPKSLANHLYVIHGMNLATAKDIAFQHCNKTSPKILKAKLKTKFSPDYQKVFKKVKIVEDDDNNSIRSLGAIARENTDYNAGVVESCDRSITPAQDKSILCPFCAEKFHSVIIMGKHMVESHLDPDKFMETMSKFRCPFCFHMHHSNTDLQNHILTMHTSIAASNDRMNPTLSTTTYSCQHCKQSFSNRSRLKSHKIYCLKNNVPGIDNLEHRCHICNKNFSNRIRLHYHRKVYHRSYKCTLCQTGFSTNSKLVTHLDMKHNVQLNEVLSNCQPDILMKRYTENSKLKFIESVTSENCQMENGISAHKEQHEEIKDEQSMSLVIEQNSFMSNSMEADSSISDTTLSFISIKNKTYNSDDPTQIEVNDKEQYILEDEERIENVNRALDPDIKLDFVDGYNDAKEINSSAAGNEKYPITYDDKKNAHFNISVHGENVISGQGDHVGSVPIQNNNYKEEAEGRNELQPETEEQQLMLNNENGRTHTTDEYDLSILERSETAFSNLSTIVNSSVLETESSLLATDNSVESAEDSLFEIGSLSEHEEDQRMQDLSQLEPENGKDRDTAVIKIESEYMSSISTGEDYVNNPNIFKYSKGIASFPLMHNTRINSPATGNKDESLVLQNNYTRMETNSVALNVIGKSSSNDPNHGAVPILTKNTVNAQTFGTRVPRHNNSPYTSSTQQITPASCNSSTSAILANSALNTVRMPYPKLPYPALNQQAHLVPMMCVYMNCHWCKNTSSIHHHSPVNCFQHNHPPPASSTLYTKHKSTMHGQSKLSKQSSAVNAGSITNTNIAKSDNSGKKNSNGVHNEKVQINTFVNPNLFPVQHSNRQSMYPHDLSGINQNYNGTSNNPHLFIKQGDVNRSSDSQDVSSIHSALNLSTQNNIPENTAIMQHLAMTNKSSVSRNDSVRAIASSNVAINLTMPCKNIVDERVIGNSPTQLRRGFREHIAAEKRRHKCPYCDLCFTQQSVRKVHMRTHTGEKPFLCTQCDKRFMDPSTYYKHKRTHTGEKPYICSICHISFTQCGNLYRHVRQVHKQQTSQ